MKCHLYILSVFTLLICSCQNESHEKQIIDRSEILLKDNPDSAYVLLNSIPVPDMLSDKLMARWCMLAGKAADKLFKDMPYSTQLTRARTWYTKYGSPEDQAWIGLYLGRSYFKDQKYLEATDAYMNALTAAQKGEAYNAAGYISSYMGDLYILAGQKSEERRKYKEAASYFQLAGNTRSYALALRDIGRTWTFEDSCSLALEYMLKADSIITNLHDTLGIASIANGLGNLYEMLGDLDKSKQAFHKALLFDAIEAAPTHLALSVLFLNNEELDSARYYLNEVGSEVHNLYTPIDFWYVKYEIEKADENPEKALACFEKYILLRDSLYDEQKQADIINAEKRYTNLLLQDENNKLRIGQLVYISLLCISVIIFLVIWILYQEKKRRHLREASKQQLLLSQKESQLFRMQAKLKEKEVEGNSIQQDLVILQKGIESIQEDLNLLRNDNFQASTIYKKVKKLSQTVIAGYDKPLLDKKEWAAIKNTLDKTYSGLPFFLDDPERNLTQSDREYCYLSFFRLEIREESILLHINPESVSKRRFRTRQKLGLEHTSIELPDYFINHI